MASVMPTSTYPKYYVVNQKEFKIRNAAEDTAFQASVHYCAGITVKSYPKLLTLGPNIEVTVNNSSEEASARAKFGQA
jgi:hypothetical protein